MWSSKERSQQLVGDCHPHTTRSNLIQDMQPDYGCVQPMQHIPRSSPTYVPTRWYHSRRLICPSLDTEAFSIFSVLYQQFNMPRTLVGSMLTVGEKALGAYPPLLLTHCPVP